MTEIWKNNAKSTVAVALESDGLSLVLASGTTFPSPDADVGEFAYVTLESADASAREIVKLTARSGAVCVIERAQQGTIARAWPIGSKVEGRLTAGTLETLRDHPLRVKGAWVREMFSVDEDGNIAETADLWDNPRDDQAYGTPGWLIYSPDFQDFLKHVPGDATPATFTPDEAPVVGKRYRLTYLVDELNAGSVAATFAGASLGTIAQTADPVTVDVTAVSTDGLVITPSSDFDGDFSLRSLACLDEIPAQRVVEVVDHDADGTPLVAPVDFEQTAISRRLWWLAEELAVDGVADVRKIGIATGLDTSLLEVGDDVFGNSESPRGGLALDPENEDEQSDWLIGAATVISPTDGQVAIDLHGGISPSVFSQDSIEFTDNFGDQLRVTHQKIGWVDATNLTGSTVPAWTLVRVVNRANNNDTAGFEPNDPRTGRADYFTIEDVPAGDYTRLQSYRERTPVDTSGESIGPIYADLDGGWTATPPDDPSRERQIVGWINWVDAVDGGIIFAPQHKTASDQPRANAKTVVDGDVAGPIAVPVALATSRLVSVIAFNAGVPADLTDEFAISDDDEINNTGGTDTTGMKLIVEWQR